MNDVTRRVSLMRIVISFIILYFSMILRIFQFFQFLLFFSSTSNLISSLRGPIKNYVLKTNLFTEAMT